MALVKGPNFDKCLCTRRAAIGCMFQRRANSRNTLRLCMPIILVLKMGVKIAKAPPITNSAQDEKWRCSHRGQRMCVEHPLPYTLKHAATLVCTNSQQEFVETWNAIYDML
eukprot:scaffold175775_cov17-Tisochrysis_lutea.AAC.2